MFSKIKELGFKRIFKLIYLYKLPNLYRKIFGILFSKLKVGNVIVFESMNDFDMNAGAIYRYLLESGLNDKYKLVWLTKNKYLKDLPPNVRTFPFFGFSILKEYYCNIARFIFYDNFAIRKRKSEQTIIYTGHATRAMKNCRGLVRLPDDVDYVLSASKSNDELMSDVYCTDVNKFVTLGMPVTDLLITHSSISKLKTIIWMPTFRKSNQESWRNDSISQNGIGLPLIETPADVKRLEEILAKFNIKLLIKLHPAQDINEIKIQNTEYITLITPDTIKDMGIDTYELLAQSSALISDYSSISFDYLLLDQPIAYILSDFEEYKLGFAVDNYFDYMPGDYLYTFDDFVEFINKVADGIDNHKTERNALKDKIHTYQDGKSCERVVNFLGL